MRATCGRRDRVSYRLASLVRQAICLQPFQTKSSSRLNRCRIYLDSKTVVDSHLGDFEVASVGRRHPFASQHSRLQVVAMSAPGSAKGGAIKPSSPVKPGNVPKPAGGDNMSDASTIYESGSATIQHVCIRCEENTTIDDSRPTNSERPFEKRICKRCGATDRGLQRLWKQKKSSRVEFQKLAHPAKVSHSINVSWTPSGKELHSIHVSTWT